MHHLQNLKEQEKSIGPNSRKAIHKLDSGASHLILAAWTSFGWSKNSVRFLKQTVSEENLSKVAFGNLTARWKTFLKFPNRKLRSLGNS